MVCLPNAIPALFPVDGSWGPGPSLVSMDLAMFSVAVEGKSVRHSPFEQSVALGVGETASSNHDGGIIWIRLTVLVSRGFFGLGRSSWD